MLPNRSLVMTALSASLLLSMAPLSAEEDEDAKKPDLPLTGHTETLAFSTDEGSWMSLDVTPDGTHIIFELLGDLYRLPIEGGHAERITSGLSYDAQPTISPQGDKLAFISDRNGANNLWVSDIDGNNARKISDAKQWGPISPAWSADGRYVVVTNKAVKNQIKLYHVDGGSGTALTGVTEEDEVWGVGVVASPDGRYLYFAAAVDSRGPVDNFPATQIVRYEISSGILDQLTQAEGGGVRPELSPDGMLLVYGSRSESKTGLRVRNLQTGDDRWLTYPVQRDGQENYRPPSRDLLPGYSFTPDGIAVVFNAEGKIWRVRLSDGEKTEIPFTANIELDVGPDLTAPYAVPQGPLTATLIHDPDISPEGDQIVASVLTKLYVQGTDSEESPERLTTGDNWEYKPVHSPDGRWIAYVTWSMNDGGHIWRVRSRGGRPQQLTDVAAFYTDLVYSPDGESLYAMRGNEYMRHQTFSEFGGLAIPLELVSIPADGGSQTVLASAHGARTPHFGADHERIYLYDDKGLFSLQIDGTDRREELVVTGPRGNQRGEKPPMAEAVKISPDGMHALALVSKQVWLLAVSRTGGNPPTIDVRSPDLPATRLTDIGADFFGWSRDGNSIWWAIGNSFMQRSVDSVALRMPDDDEDDDGETDSDEAFVPLDEHDAVAVTRLAVVVDRDKPTGSLLLQNVNVISMAGATTAVMSSVARRQDVLITNNRIAAVGDSGSLAVPDDADRIDVSGKYLLPGFIDTHAHWEFRTGNVLEPQNWSIIANLAYGVTAGLDVQTATTDYLAYRDLVDIGQSIGQRAFMTAVGIFGGTDFESYDATHSYLRRYKDHYRTPNIKSYMVGNRKQRQWIVRASQDLGLMPTTEGAADQKMNITHAIDGMHGNEHTLPDSPLFKDVVELFARTRTAYTPTLIVQYNAETMREYFFTRTNVHDNEKLQRFYPHNRLDQLTQRRPGWQRDGEFQFIEAAAQAAKIQRAGGLVGVGGHAELQGLGYHWEMWAFEMGGMTPAEVLRAATIDGAKIIGIDQDLGSIEPGKLADIVVLDANPLDNIRNTTAIHRVIQNGRVYDGNSLDQTWPEQVALEPFWWWSEDDPRFSPDSVN